MGKIVLSNSLVYFLKHAVLRRSVVEVKLFVKCRKFHQTMKVKLLVLIKTT